MQSLDCIPRDVGQISLNEKGKVLKGKPWLSFSSIGGWGVLIPK